MRGGKEDDPDWGGASGSGSCLLGGVDTGGEGCVSLQRFNATHNVSSSIDLYDKRWDWSKSHKLNTYDFQKLSKSDASDLLNGSWVVVAGDSQARCFALSLLNLILGPQAQRMYSVPYVVNLTNSMEQDLAFGDVMMGAAGDDCGRCFSELKKGGARRVMLMVEIEKRGEGIATCKKVTTNKNLEIVRLVEESENRKKQEVTREISLPSQSSAGIEIDYSSKKRKPSLLPLARAFDVNTRAQLDEEIARMFYTDDLPFNLARNPHYHRAFTFAATHNILGYVPPDTRFASIIVMLKRFKFIKKGLQAMVISDECNSYRENDTVKANFVKEKLVSDDWWNKVAYIIDFTKPIYDILRLSEDSCKVAPHRDGEISREIMKCFRRFDVSYKEVFFGSERRNKLNLIRAEDLVYIHYNFRLLSRSSSQYEDEKTKMWDVGGDAFDSLGDVGYLEFVELSFDEQDLESQLISKDVNNCNIASSIDLYEKRWDWSKSPKLNTYDFQKLSKPDASDLLNGSWVVVAGDSQARFFALSLLNLILQDLAFGDVLVGVAGDDCGRCFSELKEGGARRVMLMVEIEKRD
ncbi:hypothetical protein F3Y22_tig00112888pilonHSYRG00141 [Hibiscus syriacus]|uniref:Uncharacterized protein n=1 Tax=Hibiscus syriacus TaxID=106335 RepID=A0A6A2XYJ5_HIBSY|nr:hypothetical protein F3Y22_tig00112888pilonHSYRG00141 [Hibiscus syriacus]